MKIKALVLGLFVISGLFSRVLGQQEKPGRTAFYAAMASRILAEIDAQIDLASKSSQPEKEALEGTLLMKKAGLVSGAGKKLNLFKAGHKKLEAEIKKDNSNAEFRFFRLMIQENAPGILNYKSDLQKDRTLIRNKFKELSSVVQQAILDYSKKSKVLTPSDF